MLDKFAEGQKFAVQSFALLSFLLFLLEFVHVVQLVSVAFEVDIFCCDSRLFVELYILSLFVAQQDRPEQVEMDNHDDFIRCTWLVEAVFNVAKTDVYLLALM